MSTVENEDGTMTQEDGLTLEPAVDLDDLFDDEEPEDFEPEIPENLSEDELRSRLVAAEKKAKYERDQRLTTARKSWIEEAKKAFPYSSPEEITSDSRRSFMEEAKKQDTKFREKAAPILEKGGKTEEQIREELRQEVEADLAARWGRPTTGSGGDASAATNEETDKKIDRARGKRDFHGAVSAMMDGGRF